MLVNIIYWLPTVTITAATVYYNVSDGTTFTHTITQNMTAHYESLAISLVPPAETRDCDEYGCPVSNISLLISGTTAPYVYTKFAYNRTTLVTTTMLTAGTNYLWMNVFPEDIVELEFNDIMASDGFDVFFACVTTEDGEAETSTLMWSPFAATDLGVETIVPVPPSYTSLDNSGMTTYDFQQTFSIPEFASAALQGLFPYFSNISRCTAVGGGFPTPMVVVSELTTTISPTAGPTSSPVQPASVAASGSQPSRTSSYTSSSSTTGSGSNGNSGYGYSAGSSSGSNGNTVSGVGSAGNPEPSGSPVLPSQSRSAGSDYGSGPPSGNSGPGSSSSGSNLGSPPSNSNLGLSPSSFNIGSPASNSNPESDSSAGAGGVATFTIGGQTFTASASGGVSIAGTTLSVGSGAVTTAGEVISLNSGGVVVSLVYTETNLGGYIASGLGLSSPTTGTQAVGATTYAFGGTGGSPSPTMTSYLGTVVSAAAYTGLMATGAADKPTPGVFVPLCVVVCAFAIGDLIG